MKIQVGKTYKDGFGRDVYIEHQLSRSLARMAPVGAFLGVISTGGFAWYSEDGTCNETTNERYSLIPNKVKKEGWIALKPDSVDTSGTYASSDCHTSREAAEKKAKEFGWKDAVIAKVEWEEEE